MEKFLKSSVLILILAVFNALNIYALTGAPATDNTLVSSQFAVRNVLSNDNNIPVINVTPSRPTLVQFPEELSNCSGASKIIKLDYGDASVTSNSLSLQSNQNMQAQTENKSAATYSAVILTVALGNSEGNQSGQNNFTFDDLKEMPVTWYICRMKRQKTDTFCQAYLNNNEPYCWVAIAVRIVDPIYTNGIVILEKPNGVNSLVKPEQLEGVPFVNTFLDKKTNKIHEGKSIIDKIKSKKESEFKKPVITKKVDAILVSEAQSFKKENTDNNKIKDTVKKIEKDNDIDIPLLPENRNKIKEEDKTKKIVDLKKTNEKKDLEALVDPSVFQNVIN
ncbi:hypothetical protein [Fluviispira sanaruensis]|uniref:Uncharacterized protein n=1 Tax=Fluviispira sanaruensis TaxID=2493639 RepID=A0A4P2W0D8_FLUSA|nr:hypothetical protein [Fluviispira sanaruensis]BBH54632.1 hypothetical protein JCM31447_31060 [Fluviispira sanaruensis]